MYTTGPISYGPPKAGLQFAEKRVEICTYNTIRLYVKAFEASGSMAYMVPNGIRAPGGPPSATPTETCL